VNCVKCFSQILKTSQEKVEIFESDLSEEREKRKQLVTSFITTQKALEIDSEVLPTRVLYSSCFPLLGISGYHLFDLKNNFNCKTYGYDSWAVISK
jgi:hypothetical protein